MPSKKKSPLDAIRANQAKTRATQPYVSGSAFTNLAERNEKLSEQNEKLVAPKKTASPAHNWKTTPQPEAPTKVTKPKPKKRKANASIRQGAPVEKKKQVFEEDKEPELESWVPCGGFSSSENITVKSRSIGIARIPGWRVEKFTTQLGELLLMEIVDDDEEFKILVKTEEATSGLENLTDVYVEVKSQKRAEEVRDMLEGKMMGGRLLKVKSDPAKDLLVP